MEGSSCPEPLSPGAPRMPGGRGQGRAVAPPIASGPGCTPTMEYILPLLDRFAFTPSLNKVVRKQVLMVWYANEALAEV